jgi:hypothetical protein
MEPSMVLTCRKFIEFQEQTFTALEKTFKRRIMITYFDLANLRRGDEAKSYQRSCSSQHLKPL